LLFELVGDGAAPIDDFNLARSCGALFKPPRSDARYCTNACRQRAYRARAYP
jgi:hypothetical protein